MHVHSAELRSETAIMLQPLACVLYAIEQLGDVAGKDVAVLGIGPIGALFTHVLKTAGAARVVGVDRVDRTAVRDRFRMDEFVHADATAWAFATAEADRPHIVVEAIGHQVETLTAAVTAAAWGGTVFYFGIPNDDVYPFPMMTFLRKNMTLRAGVTALSARRRVLAAAERYLSRFPELASAYLTSPFEFSNAQSAFEAAANPREGQLKVTLVV